MPGGSRPIVFVDTNVVIEATRTNCWRALINRFEIHTVVEVRNEAQSGNQRASEYVKVDMAEFDTNVTVHEVTAGDILQATTKASNLAAIDRGERDLLACVAAQNPNALLLATGDRAAVKAACALKLDRRLCSLEELAKKCGLSPDLKSWFTAVWLSQVKTEFLLDTISLQCVARRGASELKTNRIPIVRPRGPKSCSRTAELTPSATPRSYPSDSKSDGLSLMRSFASTL